MPLAEGKAVELTPRRCRVSHAWLTEETYQLLEAEASRRRMNIDALTALILTDLSRDNLFAALLDR